LVAIEIVINVVIGGLSGEVLNDWLMQQSDYRCPIIVNCPITLSDYNFAD